jgi:cation diffusion facilitator CzcD-associated flavoprotein CzcO
MQPDHEVAIIGAGFSGIGAGIKLKSAGIEDFVILEQADDIGGTWRDNTYPGIAVDIPSFSYQYSFELNPNWSRIFAPGAEVKAYADHCVDKYGLREHIRLGTRVTKEVFDERNHLWRLHVGRKVIKARFVMAALGGLTQPKDPDIPGLEDFAGKRMHTARWDHRHDLSGERVGMIGTGATAVQLVPEVAGTASRLSVFQRTPIWVLPKPDFPMPGPVRSVFGRLPLVQDSLRLSASAAVEAGMVVGVIYNRQFPQITRGIERAGRWWIRRQVKDPDLRQALTPRYGFGCKRPSMSNDYFRSFERDDTELVTAPIERITPAGIRTEDGVERELDTLILATGYLTSEPGNAPPMPVIGRDGRDLGKFWQEERFQAYEGISTPKFPNAFAIFGPYAFTGSSWMFMVENQVHHAVRVIKEARKRGATMAEVRQEPHDEFFEHVLKRQQNTIFFNNNCGTANSYYFDSHGDAPFLRPSTALEAWWRSRHFDLDDYSFEAAA